MAIKDTNQDAEYPFVLMTEQSVGQRKMKHVSDTPDHCISLAWTYYKVEENGDITYSPEPAHTYSSNDFYSMALASTLGDMSHYNTLMAQQISIKNIIESETGTTLEII